MSDEPDSEYLDEVIKGLPIQTPVSYVKKAKKKTVKKVKKIPFDIDKALEQSKAL